MQIEIITKGDIFQNQEAHESIIETFKEKFEYFLTYQYTTFPNVEVKFNYFPKTRKFELFHFPEQYLYMFYRVRQIYWHELKQFLL